jgi:calpain-7
VVISKLINHEELHIFSKTIKGKWDRETAGGSPHWSTFINNPMFKIEMSGETQTSFQAELTASNNHNVSLMLVMVIIC